MSVDTHKETLEFQAEVSQVLNLVIRSLYSNKEIFLRELISNASDAIEKLRFEALSDDALYEDDPNLRIRIWVDRDAGTVTVADNGIGMTRDEVMETIGTIASSGTRKFLEKMTGNEDADAQLIGQFGVGFYSAFIVADRVTLTTRRAGFGKEHGVRWESTGEGSYTIETVEKEGRGTEVTLHLREQASLRSRERFWDIRVPKIDSIFDNSLVPRPSWSPGVPPQHRKLVAATHRSPI